MILKNFSQNRVHRLSKMAISTATEPLEIKFLWMQYEDFNSPSEFFNNKPHRHTFYELHFILEGTGIITDNNQKEYTVNAGEAIIILKDKKHTFKFKNESLKRFSVAFTLPENITTSSLVTEFVKAQMHSGIIENLNTIFLNADKTTVGSLYIIRNRLYEIIYEVLNFEEYINMSRIGELNYTNLYIDKSKKYINDNLNIILTCKDIANYCHINEIYLNRLFKKHIGETLHQYIQRKKIEYSIKLLKNKELSLSTISSMLGFPNEYYFNTYFKKAVGLPPGAYRKINLKVR